MGVWSQHHKETVTITCCSSKWPRISWTVLFPQIHWIVWTDLQLVFTSESLKIAVNITSLPLASFCFYTHTHTTGSHYVYDRYLCCWKHNQFCKLRRKIFYLGTPTGRRMCPVGSACDYNIMQSETVLSPVVTMYV